MKKVSVRNLESLGIKKMSRESLKNVTGGSICAEDEFMCADGTQCIPMHMKMDGIAQCRDGSDEITDCCLNELWNATGQYQETCGLSYESASYACSNRMQSQTSDYACSVTCS